MKYQNNLRIYGVYKFDKFPNEFVLVTGFGENNLGGWLEGMAFKPDGELYCKISYKLPLKGIEIGYVYDRNSSIKLKLEFK